MSLLSIYMTVQSATMFTGVTQRNCLNAVLNVL